MCGAPNKQIFRFWAPSRGRSWLDEALRARCWPCGSHIFERRESAKTLKICVFGAPHTDLAQKLFARHSGLRNAPGAVKQIIFKPHGTTFPAESQPQMTYFSCFWCPTWLASDAEAPRQADLKQPFQKPKSLCEYFLNLIFPTVLAPPAPKVLISPYKKLRSARPPKPLFDGQSQNQSGPPLKNPKCNIRNHSRPW